MIISDQGDFLMAYNLSKLKAPRMTGRVLKIFTSILEKTFAGKIIINKLKQDPYSKEFQLRSRMK